MQLPNKDTFCVAPWFQIRNENNLKKRVCCKISMATATDSEPLDHLNNDQNIRLKKNLHEGIKDSACYKCWKDEENNVRSVRQNLNGLLLHNKKELKNTWIESYFKRKQDWLSDKTLMADVKIGNTCNHACVMCIPEDSSLVYNFWEKNKTSEFFSHMLDKDPNYLDKIKMYSFKNKKYHHYLKKVLTDNKDIKIVKLLGGEPLLDKKLLEVLSTMDDVTKSSTTLIIVTNGSVDLNKTMSYLGNFKKINFVISLEGIGEVQEYARYGSDWQYVENNVKNFDRTTNGDLVIVTTLQVTTILGVNDLMKWCKENDIPLSIGIVKNPDYLSPLAIPPHIRDKILTQSNFENVVVKQDYLSDFEPLTSKAIVDTINDSKFDYGLYEKFLRYINLYEKDKNIPRLQNIFPDLYTVDRSHNLV